ncbi:MAG: hypothetical protein K8H90_07365, partial [Thermoanaerobaculia bacterium]|nr:hypothetical protein [Thermoanaerobaculia bacterium]
SATPAAQLARQIVETDGLWFDRFAELARHEGIPVRTFGRSRPEPTPGTILIAPEMYRAAANAAGWHLRALFTHRKAWRENRRAWVEERAGFLAAHPEFNQALETWIAPFEKELTRADSSRGPTRRHGRHWDRWTRWYGWILDHPDITGWRGAVTPLAVPTETEVAAIERRVRHSAQRARRRFELLLGKNPELAALEEMRLTWIRKYLRFPRPPATKLPGQGAGAPTWVAPRDRAYRDLDPKACTVQLQVLCADAGGRVSPQWRTFNFRGDPRFGPQERARRGLPELILATPGRSVAGDYLVDRLEDRKAGISGLTLVHRHGVPYLVAALPTSVPRLRIAFRSNPQAKVPADRLLPE